MEAKPWKIKNPLFQKQSHMDYSIRLFKLNKQGLSIFRMRIRWRVVSAQMELI